MVRMVRTTIIVVIADNSDNNNHNTVKSYNYDKQPLAPLRVKDSSGSDHTPSAAPKLRKYP